RLSAGGITDYEFEHEAIDLGRRQWISAFLFDRILRGQYQERLFEFESLVTDRDLFLLHCLEQRALHLGGRTIDFVGEDEIGENGTLPGGEGARLRIVNLGADYVGGQHVRRELQPGKS